MLTAGVAEFIVDQASIAVYLAGPAAFPRACLENGGAMSRMTFKLKGGADVALMATFEAALGP